MARLCNFGGDMLRGLTLQVAMQEYEFVRLDADRNIVGGISHETMSIIARRLGFDFRTKFYEFWTGGAETSKGAVSSDQASPVEHELVE